MIWIATSLIQKWLKELSRTNKYFQCRHNDAEKQTPKKRMLNYGWDKEIEQIGKVIGFGRFVYFGTFASCISIGTSNKSNRKFIYLTFY